MPLRRIQQSRQDRDRGERQEAVDRTNAKVDGAVANHSDDAGFRSRRSRLSARPGRPCHFGVDHLYQSGSFIGTRFCALAYLGR